MVNVILISDGEDHAWYDWISTELVKRGHSFFYPDFPSLSEGIDAWIGALKDYRKHLDESSIVIGHGSGRVIALKILEEKLREISGAFFISGKPLVNDFKGFSFEEVDFSTVKDKAKNFFVYGSEEDDQESLKESEVLAELLDDEVLILEGPAYFKKFDKFEDLLIDIISVIKD